MTTAQSDDAVRLRERFSESWAADRMDEIGAFFYADDAILMPPDSPPVRGRAEIVSYLKGLRAQAGVGVFGVIRTRTDGGLAYIAGTAVFPVAKLDCVTLETYQRQSDGTMKCVVDMFHSSRPAASA